MNEDHLPESSVAACMVHCLEKPDITHIMVSYREPNFFGIGEQFNCICAKVLKKIQPALGVQITNLFGSSGGSSRKG